MRFGATLRDMSMAPTVSVSDWDYFIVVAVAVTVAVVVVSSGDSCYCGKYCGGEFGGREGEDGIGDLRCHG